MMIPLRINFLPPEKYRYLKKIVFFQFISSILEIILIFLCIVGIFLLGGQWVLQDYFNKLTSEIITASNRYSQTNQEIKKINEVLLKTDRIQKEHVKWTPFITDIANRTPTPVSYTALNLDMKNKIFTFVGNAPTRDDLLKLQSELQALPWIETASIPLSQLTAKKNIQFSITAKIK